MDSSLGTEMACIGFYNIKTPTYDKSIEKTKCIRTNGMLENRLMYENMYWIKPAHLLSNLALDLRPGTIVHSPLLQNS